MAQKNMKHLPSFGGGYGINRDTPGDRALAVAEPPLSSVNVRPGSGYNRRETGKSGERHFSGAKIISGKKS